MLCFTVSADCGELSEIPRIYVCAEAKEQWLINWTKLFPNYKSFRPIVLCGEVAEYWTPLYSLVQEVSIIIYVGNTSRDLHDFTTLDIRSVTSLRI
jgi:hypothetical protein